MRRFPIDPDLHEDDQQFNEKYAPLSEQYLENAAPHANLDDVKNGLLTIKEGEYITNHTGHISDILQRNLKHNTIQQTKVVRQYETDLYDSLNKLPSFDSQITYRMERYASNIADYQQYFEKHVGETMRVPYYLSTSKEDWKSTKVVYLINTLENASNGRDISRVSNFEKEKEVLFIKNTNFLIKGIKEQNKVLYVEMEETLQKENFVYNYVEIGFDETLQTDDQELGLFD